MKLTDFYKKRKIPVTSVNSKIGDVVLNASDVNAVSRGEIGIIVPTLKDGVVPDTQLPDYVKPEQLNNIAIPFETIMFQELTDNINYIVSFDGILPIIYVISPNNNYYSVQSSDIQYDTQYNKTVFHISRFLIKQNVNSFSGIWKIIVRKSLYFN